MSDPEKDAKTTQSAESSEGLLDDDEIRALLRSAMTVPANQPPPDVLKGVQRKIRQRSRGKFYADGWSTVQSPKSTYFVTALVMLAVLFALYFALVPGGWGTP